jgi:hypothetical protein
MNEALSPYAPPRGPQRSGISFPTREPSRYQSQLKTPQSVGGPKAQHGFSSA